MTATANDLKSRAEAIITSVNDGDLDYFRLDVLGLLVQLGVVTLPG